MASPCWWNKKIDELHREIWCTNSNRTVFSYGRSCLVYTDLILKYTQTIRSEIFDIFFQPDIVFCSKGLEISYSKEYTTFARNIHDILVNANRIPIWETSKNDRFILIISRLPISPIEIVVEVFVFLIWTAAAAACYCYLKVSITLVKSRQRLKHSHCSLLLILYLAHLFFARSRNTRSVSVHFSSACCFVIHEWVEAISKFRSQANDFDCRTLDLFLAVFYWYRSWRTG